MLKTLLITLLLGASAMSAMAQPSTINATCRWDYQFTGQDGFVLQRKAGTTGTYEDVATVGTEVRQATDQIQYGQVYCWQVIAKAGTTRGAPGNEVCKLILGPTSNLTVTVP